MRGPWYTAPARSTGEEGPPRGACHCRWSWKSLLERFWRAGDRFSSEFAGEVGKCLIGASGYHSLASFHKDDNRGWPAKSLRRGTIQAGGIRNVHSKLLNMRDFQPLSGVSPRGQNALQFKPWQPGKRIGVAYFYRLGCSCRDAPLARPGFVP